MVLQDGYFVLEENLVDKNSEHSLRSILNDHRNSFMDFDFELKFFRKLKN